MSDNLVMQYAQNRIDLKAINKAIRKLLLDEYDDFYEIDITPYRDEWYDKDYAWAGWEAAVNDSENDPTDEEKELARLLDLKAKNRAEAGQIKRNIYARGSKLIRDNK